MENRIKELMAVVFDIEINEITDNSSPLTISNWDSLRHMNLIVALEEEYNIEFDDTEAMDLKNYRKMIEMIEKKLT